MEKRRKKKGKRSPRQQRQAEDRRRRRQLDTSISPVLTPRRGTWSGLLTRGEQIQLSGLNPNTLRPLLGTVVGVSDGSGNQRLARIVKVDVSQGQALAEVIESVGPSPPQTAKDIPPKHWEPKKVGGDKTAQEQRIEKLLAAGYVEVEMRPDPQLEEVARAAIVGSRVFVPRKHLAAAKALKASVPELAPSPEDPYDIWVDNKTVPTRRAAKRLAYGLNYGRWSG